SATHDVGHVVNNGAMTFTGTNTFTGTVLDNAAAATLGVNNTLVLQGGAVFNNQAAGTVTITGTGSVQVSNSPASAFNNAGLLSKNSSGTFQFNAALVNT